MENVTTNNEVVARTAILVIGIACAAYVAIAAINHKRK